MTLTQGYQINKKTVSEVKIMNTRQLELERVEPSYRSILEKYPDQTADDYFIGMLGVCLILSAIIVAFGAALIVFQALFEDTYHMYHQQK